MKKVKDIPFRFSFVAQYSLALITLVLSDPLLKRAAKKMMRTWREKGLPGLTRFQVQILKYMIEDTSETLMKRELEEKEKK